MTVASSPVLLCILDGTSSLVGDSDQADYIPENAIQDGSHETECE